MYFVVFFERVLVPVSLDIVLKDCILLYFLNPWLFDSTAPMVLKDCILLYFLNGASAPIHLIYVLKDCILLYSFDIFKSSPAVWRFFMSSYVDSLHMFCLGGRLCR